MLVFRFLAGLGGAAPQSVGGAVVGDLWAPEASAFIHSPPLHLFRLTQERGMAMSAYSLAPLVRHILTVVLNTGESAHAF